MAHTNENRPARGNAPFVMHLERVCRLADMGQRFAVEFNPCGDVPVTGLIRDVAIRIREDGDVHLLLLDGTTVMAFGLTLANYKRVWRCWQNGIPTEAQRRAARWG